MLRSTSNLKRASFPLKKILETPEQYQASIEQRNVKLPNAYTIEKLALLSEKINVISAKRQAAATERNLLVKKIKNLVGKENKQDKLGGDLLSKSKTLKTVLKDAETDLANLVAEQNGVLDSIPNLISPSSAHITEDFEIDSYLNPRQVEALSMDHTTIGSKLGIIDLASGSRVSGTGHYFLVGAGAMLEQALIQYALEKCRTWGFKLVSVPHLIRSEFTSACGFKPRDQNDEVQVYSVKGGSGQDNLCLAGTAEIPLASWRAHQTIKTPLSACAVSRSFRAEAGARGADTKGLYRVHEFTKVEMFMWTSPDLDESTKALYALLEHQKEMIASLGLTARVIRIGATDMGNPAYEKFDIEAWMPGRGQWGEVTSVSNCTDFQSRRLWTVDTNGQFVHTLNGTAMAIPRIIVAILENNYDPETNKVRVPQALRKWMPEYIQCD